MELDAWQPQQCSFYQVTRVSSKYFAFDILSFLLWDAAGG